MLTEILRRAEEQPALPPAEQKVVQEVERKRLQRDQRFATAMNAVTQARIHGGRSEGIMSPADAATANMIFNLLQPVADEPPLVLDPLFTKLKSFTVSSTLEVVAATCQTPQSADEEFPPSSEQQG